jgi:hypothetical protein
VTPRAIRKPMSRSRVREAGELSRRCSRDRMRDTLTAP